MMSSSNNVDKKSSKKEQSTSTAIKNYLIGYNVFQTLGWSFLFYKFLTYYTSSSNSSLYETVKWPLIIFQNAAILEVLHAALRFVPSNPFITFMQIASRVMVVCGVLMVTQAARETIGLPLALIAWCITEIIRYSNYAFNLTGAVPYIISWLRYSTFYVLYPLGVTGEVLCVYAAQGEVARTKIFTVEMPNSVNFIFNYRLILCILMLIYIPFFPLLYMHMMTLRKKVLGRAKKTQ